MQTEASQTGVFLKQNRRLPLPPGLPPVLPPCLRRPRKSGRSNPPKRRAIPSPRTRRRVRTPFPRKGESSPRRAIPRPPAIPASSPCRALSSPRECAPPSKPPPRRQIQGTNHPRFFSPPKINCCRCCASPFARQIPKTPLRRRFHKTPAAKTKASPRRPIKTTPHPRLKSRPQQSLPPHPRRRSHPLRSHPLRSRWLSAAGPAAGRRTALRPGPSVCRLRRRPLSEARSTPFRRVGTTAKPSRRRLFPREHSRRCSAAN